MGTITIKSMAAFIFIAVLSGCSSAGDIDSAARYDDLKQLTFSQNAGVGVESDGSELNELSTLPDYLAYAALHNPGLKAAFNRWKASLERIPQVRSLPDPRFTYAYYIENVETRVGPQRHKIDLSQAFTWFGKLELLGEAALEGANIEKQNFEALKVALFYRVKETWLEYYYLSRSIAITEENMKLLAWFEKVARSKYESGKSTYADILKAQVELGKLEERLLSLNDLRSPLTADLNAAMNRPADTIIPWPTVLPERELSISDDEIVRRFDEFNPGLKALDSRSKKEGLAVDIAKKEFYPTILFGLSYIETGHTPMPGVSDSGKDPVMSMLSVNIPIWRNKYRAAVKEAEFHRKSTIMERENKVNNLTAETKKVLNNYRDSERKIELYRDTLIPKIHQSMNVTQSAFEAGKMEFINLIDSQRTLLELELAYERSRTNRAKYLARIEMLIGKDLD